MPRLPLRFFCLLLLGWTAVGLAGTAGAHPSHDDDHLRIGILAPVTGSAEATGREMLHGAALAVEQINAAGGVRVGKKRMELELVTGDTQSTAEGGVAAANALIQQQVVSFIGAYGSATTLAAQVPISAAKLPYLVSGASTPRITRRTDLDTSRMFHLHELGPWDGAAAARFLAEAARPALAPKRNLRVAVLYQDTAFGQDFLNGLPGLGLQGYTEARGLPLDLVAVEPFANGATDFEEQLLRVRDADPDIIVPVALVAEAIPMLHQAVNELGMSVPWGPVNKVCESPAFYEAIDDLRVPIFIGTYFSVWDTPRGKAGRHLDSFRGQYVVRWGELPGLEAALQYEAIYTLKAVYERARTLRPAKVTQAFRSLNTPSRILPTVKRKIRFDKNREVRFDLFVTQLFFDEELGRMRSRIVWPASLATGPLDLEPEPRG
ncbi:MAG: ABC transporter substrate-binding protein [Armatimonadota bacterium]